MTIRFKKIKDFDRKIFFEDFEKDFVKTEDDIYVVDELEEKVESDLISPSELWFMMGYMEASSEA